MNIKQFLRWATLTLLFVGLSWLTLNLERYFEREGLDTVLADNTANWEVILYNPAIPYIVVMFLGLTIGLWADYFLRQGEAPADGEAPKKKSVLLGQEMLRTAEQITLNLRNGYDAIDVFVSARLVRHRASLKRLKIRLLEYPKVPGDPHEQGKVVRAFLLAIGGLLQDGNVKEARSEAKRLITEFTPTVDSGNQPPQVKWGAIHQGDPAGDPAPCFAEVEGILAENTRRTNCLTGPTESLNPEISFCVFTKR